MKFIILLLLAMIGFNVTAQDWAKPQTSAKQSPTEVKLDVGDRIPFAELHNMVNYPKTTFKFSDHRKKLTLLDFWATTCGPCIKFWPTALKLQDEFKNDFQIIPINSYESAKQVRAFLAKRKRIDGFDMTLPMSCRDSTLWKNFPSGSLPRYVWIDEKGVINAITEGGSVTRENIRKWITSGPFKMENLYEKTYYPVKKTLPIFVNGNGGDRPSDVFVWTSSLTKGQDDNVTSSNIFYDSIQGYVIALVNSPIIALYGNAFNYRLREYDYFDYLPLSRIELTAKDTAKYYWDGTLSGNAFNYQLISGKPKSRKELLTMMQEDLQRYFGLNARWEKRVKKCLVLSMFDSTLATKKKSLGAEIQVRDGKIVFDSVSVKGITTAMEMGTAYYRDRLYPIVDETNYKGVITGLREESKTIDEVTLDRILSKFGLRLKFEMREVDILVLTEPGMD